MGNYRGVKNEIGFKTAGIACIVLGRNYYDENGMQYKQISNNGHNHKKEAEFGKYGEHAHDYVYNPDGSLIKRRNALIENPALALPNAKNATADDRKFTEYLFGGNNKRGLAKGRAFTSRLGYDINNYGDLKAEILKNADKYLAIEKETDIYGTKYEQKIVVYGHKNKPANVIIGWKEKDGRTWLTSAYIKELK